MSNQSKRSTYLYHRYLDESGDTTFYGKNKLNIIGAEGVSRSFLIGMVKSKASLEKTRKDIIDLQAQISKDKYFSDVPSVQKRINNKGFFFHATDDPPEIRKIFYDYINSLKCSYEAIVGRKNPSIYERKHNGKESEFYADILSHLIKSKLGRNEIIVLNIAERGSCTKNINLSMALEKAKHRVQTNPKKKTEIRCDIRFNVQTQLAEPLLNVADYFGWALYRVFERGELRYYNYLKDKIPMIVDLYDFDNFQKWGNYYNPEKPLTEKNKIGPFLH